MTTNPKALYTNAAEKAQMAFALLCCIESEIITLRKAEEIHRQLRDAEMSMTALIRIIKSEPIPPEGEAQEDKV